MQRFCLRVAEIPFYIQPFTFAYAHYKTGSLTVNNERSHSFTSSRQTSSKLAQSAVEKNKSSNKLGTRN
jgi:hypothetical protein